MLPRTQLRQFEVLTFDCYGTLIDWESGILGALRPLLKAHGRSLGDKEILELYAELEPKAQEGDFIPYRAVLKKVAWAFAERAGFVLSPGEDEALARSIKDWKPFGDTVSALKELKGRFKLAIISNIDDELIAETAKALEVPFDWVITAQQVKAYKPSQRNFIYAIGKMDVPFNRVLHVAQSLFHDIAPTKALGISNVWVNRRRGQEGSGATAPAQAKPDMEVPDLRTLAGLLLRL